MPKITDTYRARSRSAWRSWLRKNHRRKTEIWLLLYKKHVDKPGVSYAEAVEEALCFGWIDGILKRIDDESHVIRFSPRKPKSRWADSNRRRVAAMIEAGQMTPAGMALVEAAQKSGAWDETETLDRPPSMPQDLAAALARNQRAAHNFDGFAPGYQRDYLRWVLAAKRPETRQRRIREVVKRAARNQKPGMM
ncbi:MAG: YdeI/OmpD-associated family protein [Deltaproteobacteria bacterium]|nr:YdeI/OmpD-associated family protein [Deltaproteobacteria bacterium]